MVLLVQARGVTFHGFDDKEMAGALMGWMVVATAVATLTTSELGEGIRANTRIALGGLALVVAGLLIVGFAHGVAGVAVGVALLGLGSGALGAALLTLVGALVDAGHRGAGVGMLQLCGDIGGSLGPIAGTALFAAGPTTAYVGCAAVVACFLPVAAYLARRAG